MTAQVIVASITLFGLFILFLVISKTMNNTINMLVKLQFIFQMEYELKSEALEIKRLMDSRAEEDPQSENIGGKMDSPF